MLLDNIAKSQKVKIEDGISKIFDPLRNKYLSSDSYDLIFNITHSNVFGLRYMAYNGVYTSDLDYKMPKKATIVSSNLITDSTNVQFTIYVRKNKLDINILSIQNNSGLNYMVTNDLNIDINEGDTIQVLFESDQTQKVNYPTLILQLRWR